MVSSPILYFIYSKDIREKTIFAQNGNFDLFELWSFEVPPTVDLRSILTTDIAVPDLSIAFSATS